MAVDREIEERFPRKRYRDETSGDLCFAFSVLREMSQISQSWFEIFCVMKKYFFRKVNGYAEAGM